MKKGTKTSKIKVEGGFDILTNVPLPEDQGRKGIKSPFRKTVEAMKIGQAFDADNLPRHHYSIQKKLGIKLITRKLNDGKVRVWRKS